MSISVDLEYWPIHCNVDIVVFFSKCNNRVTYQIRTAKIKQTYTPTLVLDILSHFSKMDKRRDGFHLLLKIMTRKGKSDSAIEQIVYSNATYTYIYVYIQNYQTWHHQGTNALRYI